MHSVVAGARRVRQIVVRVTLSLAPNEVRVVALHSAVNSTVFCSSSTCSTNSNAH